MKTIKRENYMDPPLSDGQLFLDGEHGIWVWLADDHRTHIDNCATRIGDGKVIHQSRIPLPHTAVYGSEVMW